ncbi:ABC-type nitrate/sulfonate/bicarbonate transport system, permease component [Roseovarius mucosus DSM 17069]|uniref:ABC-type nitrate/sulfonate/bicarbonate transport system, permease component n=1 Tax=Roseovarius mucosus DSM 17069 TaxID=1288298 RepID=A0A0A0HR08_9RHOB|nr:ABC transporter permease subunit [Roseovarius mucosus]KGM89346.1 ABC-type nitrate/sulfonate/bicarbonate transport system, permease component [Roseovarius mucosus DSM 17069]|tara:strand:- start:6 stop:1271 length:1266 start_codon:yes stop_codon:yes gene_type:complete
MIILIIYVAIFAASFFVVRLGVRKFRQMNDFTSLKTVTFGDESAVRPDRWASVISVVTIFLIWGAFTGSKWVPIHAPGPFIGDTEFTYTLEGPDGTRDDATVTVRVFTVGETVEEPVIEPGEGIAKNDVLTVGAWRSQLLLMDKNDEVTRDQGAKVIAIDGKPVSAGQTVAVADGTVAVTAKGSLNFAPAKGMQMEPIWLPAPEAVVSRLIEVSKQGYQNFTLLEHLYWSLFRVIVGFALGALVGIPLGYAMGLSDWFRGWFDPIVEFMRPVPPLALIPLVIIWAGIGESGKIILLFLAALWIMTISARAGVSGVAISKVHAAYSLGASKWQLMRHVIVPNSLPEIFTGARVAMGVCWGTVVAAELVAAEKGAGMMIMVASRFQLTDIVLMGIILIGIIGYGIDILMRKAENWLVPWKGRV